MKKADLKRRADALEVLAGDLLCELHLLRQRVTPWPTDVQTTDNIISRAKSLLLQPRG